MLTYYPRPIIRKTENANGRKPFREAIRQNAQDIALNWVAYVEGAKCDGLKKKELLNGVYLHIKTSLDQETFQLISQDVILSIASGLEDIFPDDAKSIRRQYFHKSWELNLK